MAINLFQDAGAYKIPGPSGGVIALSGRDIMVLGDRPDCCEDGVHTCGTLLIRNHALACSWFFHLASMNSYHELMEISADGRFKSTGTHWVRVLRDIGRQAGRKSGVFVIREGGTYKYGYPDEPAFRGQSMPSAFMTACTSRFFPHKALLNRHFVTHTVTGIDLKKTIAPKASFAIAYDNESGLIQTGDFTAGGKPFLKGCEGLASHTCLGQPTV